VGGDQDGRTLVRVCHNCLIVAELEFIHDRLVATDTTGSGELIGERDHYSIDPWNGLAGETCANMHRTTDIRLQPEGR
jgi:hypothetical protein